MHLVAVEFKDEAERKRVEYVIEKWKGAARISRLKGISIIVEGDPKGFLEELFSKLSPESTVKFYRIEELDLKPERKKKEFTVRTTEKPEIAFRLLDYVMQKNNAISMYLDNRLRRYFILTRKGRVEVDVSIEENSEIAMKFRLEGFGDVEAIADRLRRDLRILEGGGIVR